MVIKKVIGISAFALSLSVLTGCDSSKSSSDTIELGGTVSDGYLEGADVCLDKNNNMVCDPNEPQTKTVAGGKYKFELNKEEDFNAYSVIVNVGTQTIDEDTGMAVSSPYTLSALRGDYKFISPITTLARNEYNLDPSLTPKEIKEKVAEKLGLNKADYEMIDEDFIKGKFESTDQDRANKFKKLHKKAQIIARLQGKAEDKIKELGADGDMSKKEKLALIMSNIDKQMGRINIEVDSIEDDDSIVPDDIVKGIDLDINSIADKNVFKSEIDKIKEKIKKSQSLSFLEKSNLSEIENKDLFKIKDNKFQFSRLDMNANGVAETEDQSKVNDILNTQYNYQKDIKNGLQFDDERNLFILNDSGEKVKEIIGVSKVNLINPMLRLGDVLADDSSDIVKNAINNIRFNKGSYAYIISYKNVYPSWSDVKINGQDLLVTDKDDLLAKVKEGVGQLGSYKLDDHKELSIKITSDSTLESGRVKFIVSIKDPVTGAVISEKVVKEEPFSYLPLEDKLVFEDVLSNSDIYVKLGEQNKDGKYKVMMGKVSNDDDNMSKELFIDKKAAKQIKSVIDNLPLDV